MSKQKTRKSLKNRVKVTGTGKILYRSTHLRHLRSKKKKSRIRRLRHQTEVKGKVLRKFKKMIPYDVR